MKTKEKNLGIKYQFHFFSSDQSLQSRVTSKHENGQPLRGRVSASIRCVEIPDDFTLLQQGQSIQVAVIFLMVKKMDLRPLEAGAESFFLFLFGTSHALRSRFDSQSCPSFFFTHQPMLLFWFLLSRMYIYYILHHAMCIIYFMHGAENK